MSDYGFEYDVETNSSLLTEGDRSVRISYPNATAPASPSTEGGVLVMTGVWEGVDVFHRLFGSSLHVGFSLSEGAVVSIELEFSSAVRLKQGGSGMITAVNSRGTEIWSMIFGEMTDDTGMSGRSPKVLVSGSGTTWRISIDGSGDWIFSPSRVRPVRIPVSMAFSVPTAEVASLARISETEGEAELYRDTRPDSAIQFYVEFYDDEQFRRPRGKKDGTPVCSTVPFGVGDIWDFDTEDQEKWEAGEGYEARTVYLQFIASKAVPFGTSVYYDVMLPGTVDYLGKVAQPTDMLVDGLPVFRGSFVLKENAPPAYADGTGYINVYVMESRSKDLPLSLRVLGKANSDELGLTLEVTESFRGGVGLPINFLVQALGRAALPITIYAEQPGAGSSVMPLQLELEVIEYGGGDASLVLYDRFDSFGTSGDDI